MQILQNHLSSFSSIRFQGIKCAPACCLTLWQSGKNESIFSTKGILKIWIMIAKPRSISEITAEFKKPKRIIYQIMVRGDDCEQKSCSGMLRMTSFRKYWWIRKMAELGIILFFKWKIRMMARLLLWNHTLKKLDYNETHNTCYLVIRGCI